MIRGCVIGLGLGLRHYRVMVRVSKMLGIGLGKCNHWVTVRAVCLAIGLWKGLGQLVCSF